MPSSTQIQVTDELGASEAIGAQNRKVKERAVPQKTRRMSCNAPLQDMERKERRSAASCDTPSIDTGRTWKERLGAE